MVILFKKMIKNMDQFICKYLGLEYDQAHPKRLHWSNKKLLITHTSSFKRHTMKSTWEDFQSLPKNNLELLGKSLGKSIADKLVVSFKEPLIRMDHDERFQR